MGVKVLIVRHASAGDREEFKRTTNKPDRFRPLTPKGKKEMLKISKVIRRSLRDLDVILTSPYKRAEQTAALLAKRYKRARVITLRELKPLTSPQRTFAALRKMDRASVIAIVGHEPHLSAFLSFVLTGDTRTHFDIKKGGFAIVEFSNKLEAAKSRLLCLVQPSLAKKAVKS